MTRALIFLALLALAGCASAPVPEPKVVIRDVPVAVATSCLPKDVPQRPAFTDTAQARKAAPNAAVDYQLLASNWPLHTAYEDALEAIIKGCK